MSTLQRVYQVAVAIIRRGTDVLLVQQQEPYDPVLTWVLPGGGVEANELLHEALIREVREETGLKIKHPGHLIYVVQIDNPLEDRQLVVYVFELHEWHGYVKSADPDGYVLQACFLPLAEAIALLEADHFRPRCEPALAYLRGECESGALWLYRRRGNGKDDLVWRPRE